jgi:predicted component of type VI protein secretion system
MYELNSLTEFNAAEFFPLFENEKDILAADFIAFEEKGGTKKELNMETRYIGLWCQ